MDDKKNNVEIKDIIDSIKSNILIIKENFKFGISNYRIKNCYISIRDILIDCDKYISICNNDKDSIRIMNYIISNMKIINAIFILFVEEKENNSLMSSYKDEMFELMGNIMKLEKEFDYFR